jgi:uncharacterized glyoxalase superfamily protein PhnB
MIGLALKALCVDADQGSAAPSLTMSASSVIPCLRYRDAPAAIDWLCRVFGFERHLVVPDETGGIAHAQLVIGSGSGSGMIMLGSARDDAYGSSMRQPDEIGDAQTQTSYLVVADPDAVHARVLAAGTRVVLPLKDEDYGGRGFSCLDLEGHLWSIGSYDPWV